MIKWNLCEVAAEDRGIKMVVYYFSGTGNSLKAARDIAARCGGTIRAIREPIGATEHTDAIGFVFPCYFGGMPNIVERFIRESAFSADYFFTVVTYGGTAGNSIYDVCAMLQEKELKLDYGKAISAYPNYVVSYPMFRNPRTTTRKQDRKVAAIAGDILARKQSEPPKQSAFMVRFSGARVKLAGMDAEFGASDACVHCGLCAKLCPAGNIEMADGKPRFLHKCEQCMACVQWCPKRAVNTPKTVKRGRYHHPDVTVEDMLKMVD
jgi:ferredoxin